MKFKAEIKMDVLKKTGNLVAITFDNSIVGMEVYIYDTVTKEVCGVYSCDFTDDFLEAWKELTGEEY